VWKLNERVLGGTSIFPLDGTSWKRKRNFSGFKSAWRRCRTSIRKAEILQHVKDEAIEFAVVA
jgi:hypothetical protein